MKAVQIHAYGGPEELRHEEVPRPEPGEGEVLVRVHAASVNPVDSKSRAGGAVVMRPGGQRLPLPIILGWDVSGTVESAGAGADFAPGDEVYGMIRFPEIGAAYAEYATAPAAHLARKPASLSHEEAAALPLVALTAWQALFDTAGLSAGQRVLIHAAAGGVGHVAVQLARWKGAEVIGTASARNEGFLRELGVDRFVDYNAGPLEEAVGGDVDVVLDPIGGETQERSLRLLRRGGILVSIVGAPPADRAAELGVRGERILVRPHREQLVEIARLVEEGKLRPTLDSVFPLAEARAAHERIDSHRARGKIVLRVPG
ncbi:MAG: NADP-dependent oxidoreductase [Gemmatimonadetes bacterium]|nr:NADP-dependent oxidoreductase [Gemmatimonadota bacterium]